WQPPPLHSHQYHLFLLGFVGFCMDSFVQGQKNNTLIFTRENTIRNCTCPNEINDNDCDYSLANLICNCRTVLPYSIDKTYYNNLAVWFTETSMLGMLLNFTAVHDLKLSFCGTIPLSTKYLTIWGLRRLQIRSEINGQLKEQSMTIYDSHDDKTQGTLHTVCKDKKMLMHIAILDTSLFNRYSPLRSYSVDNVSSFTDHFPHLPSLDTFFAINNKSCVVTFIY
uniref:Exosomal polycystin 1 interacting protein n=1 Tax=Salvator merianae TaxID=96440 RepID=A0A8D0ED10_SALMN